MLWNYMSFSKIGTARVDLILPKDTYSPGDIIKGYYFIVGGARKQQVNRIESDFILFNQTEGTKKVIDFTTILTSKMITSAEENTFPFAFKIPFDIPFSSNDVSYYFHTRIAFHKGIESKDQDSIIIV
ncbi:sporulation protein [Bacillus sp. HMF5848]|uniref:sporulation protein n=1 Tax=Bacillus sp. HMF5848 TaxID=2495421 RepID=UPI0021AD657B|nr:sporulation protein [Bacillus sp. HMF5848]